MTDTTVTANLQTIKFRTDFFREYVRNNRFSPYSGTGVDNPVVIKEGREPTIRHPFIGQLSGAGVVGATTLRGSGEAMANHGWDTNPTYYRNAVEFNKEDKEKTNIDLMRAARPLLLDWAMSATKTRQIEALGAIYDGTTYSTYEAAAEAAKDAWQVTNTGRVLYGDNIAHTGDDSVDVAGCDATNDQFVRGRLDDLRRLAEDASPHIRPIRTDSGSEIYVVFAGSNNFNNLKADLETLNSNADHRGMKMTKNGNILSKDDDLFWNGCIIRKVPEITTVFSAAGKSLATAGAAGIAVEPAFLCGAQALVWGMGQRPEIVVDKDFDYNFRPGVAVELKEDIKKAYFNEFQHGVVTGYFAA